MRCAVDLWILKAYDKAVASGTISFSFVTRRGGRIPSNFI